MALAWLSGARGEVLRLGAAMAQGPFQGSRTKPLPSRAVPASVMRMMAPRVAKAKATASGTPAVPMPAFCEFIVSVNLAGGKLLGLDVDWADGKTLYVKSVQSGAVDDWNAKNQSRAVKSGDRVVSVNGYSGNAGIMVDECRTSVLLELVVRTKRRVPSSEVLVTDADEGSSEAAAKKPRLDDNLYAGMPAPDPEKDTNADSKAKKSDIFAEPPVPENPALAVFLDIDGVLRKLDGCTIAIDGEVLPLSVRGRAFEPDAVRALKYIVHRTGAGVVLSSEWRRNSTLREEVATALRAVGLPTMWGATVVLEAREEVIVGSAAAPERDATLQLRWAERRSREITSWLREHKEVRRWVALDDIDLGRADEVRLPDTAWMSRNLVRTVAEEGLTLSDARKAVERLLKPR